MSLATGDPEQSGRTDEGDGDGDGIEVAIDRIGVLIRACNECRQLLPVAHANFKGSVRPQVFPVNSQEVITAKLLVESAEKVLAVSKLNTGAGVWKKTEIHTSEPFNNPGGLQQLLDLTKELATRLKADTWQEARTFFCQVDSLNKALPVCIQSLQAIEGSRKAAAEARIKVASLESAVAKLPPIGGPNVSLSDLKNPTRLAHTKAKGELARAEKSIQTYDQKLRNQGAAIQPFNRYFILYNSGLFERISKTEKYLESKKELEELEARLPALEKELGHRTTQARLLLLSQGQIPENTYNVLQRQFTMLTNPFSLLPVDVACYIFSLSCKNQSKYLRMGLVCKSFLSAMRFPNFWCDAYVARFGKPCSECDHVDWFKKYLNRSKAFKQAAKERRHITVHPIEECNNTQCPELVENCTYTSATTRTCPQCHKSTPWPPPAHTPSTATTTSSSTQPTTINNNIITVGHKFDLHEIQTPERRNKVVLKVQNPMTGYFWGHPYIRNEAHIPSFLIY
ncbi:hypothetical protein Pelo_3694 [Pelomyxa schiedti]|nr:hypothetical protein Pelo_3694 [Pelomyxa schiedti]